jgi:hypothetical protein
MPAGADTFCSQRFWASEAALRAICVLYNLVEEFRGALAVPMRRTLATLRTRVFACEALLSAWAATRASAVPRDVLATTVLGPTPAPSVTPGETTS